MFSFPLSKFQIETLTEKDIDIFIQLDKHGILFGANETFELFKIRLINLLTEIESLHEAVKSEESIKIYPKISLNSTNIIDTSKFTEPCRITEKYSFSIDWAPGFFAEKSIGFLTGGFTVISETGLPIFILRSNFKGKAKWFLYSLNELLSHELCHVARSPLADKSYEEFFAYRLSPSRFRRYIGSFFHSSIDSLLMLIPFFLLLIVTMVHTFYYTGINELYFWILSLIYPTFLFVRNFYYRKIFKKAYKAIAGLTDAVSAESILFRSTSNEIKTISKYLKSSTEDLQKQLKEFSRKSIRWKIILRRFL